jgi:hypothetical protein
VRHRADHLRNRMEILTKNSDVQRLAARILCGVATLDE